MAEFFDGGNTFPGHGDQNGKKDSNRSQNQNESELKSESRINDSNDLQNESESKSKRIGVNRSLNRSRGTNRSLNRSQSESESESESESNRSQNAHKIDTFSKLKGLQKSIVLFIFGETRRRADNETNPIKSHELAKAVNSTSKTVKPIIRKLETKGIVERIEFHPGQAGWSRYRLHSSILNEILTSGIGVGIGVESESKDHISSSSINNRVISLSKETTTNAGAGGRAHAHMRGSGHEPTWPSWELSKLDYACLERIGFGESQARQLWHHGLSFDAVQESIWNYDYEITFEPSSRSIKDYLRCFMHRMLREGYWPVPPKMRNLKKFGDARLEADKMEIEGERKIKMQAEKKFSKGDPTEDTREPPNGDSRGHSASERGTLVPDSKPPKPSPNIRSHKPPPEKLSSVQKNDFLKAVPPVIRNKLEPELQ
jgi:hypothetical protein